MILRFGVENFRSFRDRAELSFVSTARRDEPSHRFESPGAAHGVLPVVGLWGANASGKSNLLFALVELHGLVKRSFTGLQPGQPVPWAPWRLDKGGDAPPTTMDIDLLVDGVRHHYGFRYSSERIIEEWLYAWPVGSQRVLFHRNHDEDDPWYFGPSLKDTRRVQKATRPNSLYLSAAAQHNHAYLGQVYKALVGSMVAVPLLDTKGHPVFAPSSALLEPSLRPVLMSLLAAADFGVTGVREVELPEATENLRANLSSSGNPDFDGFLADIEQRGPLKELWLTHGAPGEDGWESPPALESRGTHVFLHRMDLMFQVLRNGALWIIDEIDMSLHPDLCRAIVQLFTNPSVNKAGAQLLFTTHDRGLLSVLRTDEVVLVEKGRDGASTLHVASDFKTYRTRDDLRQVHEQGRIGGVPVLGDLPMVVEDIHRGS